MPGEAWWWWQWQWQAPGQQREGRREAAEPQHPRMSGRVSPTLEKSSSIGHTGEGKAVGQPPDSISVQGVSYAIR